MLEANVKDMIVADCKDFINSEEVGTSHYSVFLLYSYFIVVRRTRYSLPSRLSSLWCPWIWKDLIDPCLGWRTWSGYLCSEFERQGVRHFFPYVAQFTHSLNRMSDNTLTQLMGHLPTRCIVLLEDLDASFTHSTTRDKKSTGVPSVSTSSQSAESDGSSLTLSGLLNA